MTELTTDVQRFKELVNSSERILITSHISPDPDAVSSIALMGAALAQNFEDKQIMMVAEEKPTGLGFLAGFDQILFEPVFEKISQFKPDLFILLDANNYERCSRQDGQKIREYVSANSVKTIVIDHHETAGKDDVTLFVNNHQPSTVQEVYTTLGLAGLAKPPGAAQTAMTGFYADTGGFVYVKDGRAEEVFGFAAQLVKDGADIEAVKNQLESYSEKDIKILGRLAANITHGRDYSYSFLSDDFINRSNLTSLDLQRPTNTFLNSYIRNIDGRRWGFIVYKNLLQGGDYYSVSFRSQGGEPDVSLMAQALGGGGHKPAAGAKFEAKSLEEAIDRVKKTIMEP